MKQILSLIIIFIFLTSCNNNSGTRIREEVMGIAENYIADNLGDTTKLILQDGTMIIGGDQKKYVLYPGMIFTGLIDEDTKEDAIVSIFPYQGNFEVTTEHLFIINISGKLTLLRIVESDMKILNIEDGIITAEVPEHSRNSPLFDCPSCQEVVKYRFVSGELVRIDE